ATRRLGGTPELGGEAPGGQRLPVRDALQPLPDTEVVPTAAQLHRQLEVPTLAGEVLLELVRERDEDRVLTGADPLPEVRPVGQRPVAGEVQPNEGASVGGVVEDRGQLADARGDERVAGAAHGVDHVS